VCGPNGECAPASPEQQCALDCSDIVLALQEGADATQCLGYAAMPVNGNCDDGGQCTVLDPVAAGCLMDPPSVIAACGSACVQDASLCVAGVTGVGKAGFCALDTQTANCATTCTPDNNSDAAKCDGNGDCQHTLKPCGIYKCDINTGLCPAKCMNDSDCVSNQCQGTKCQP